MVFKDLAQDSAPKAGRATARGHCRKQCKFLQGCLGRAWSGAERAQALCGMSRASPSPFAPFSPRAVNVLIPSSRSPQIPRARCWPRGADIGRRNQVPTTGQTDGGRGLAGCASSRFALRRARAARRRL
eukprot:7122325-Pyramimonas_sp.AAC.1